MPCTVTILYPATAQTTFDLDFYINTHIPLTEKQWKPWGLKGWTVSKLDGSAGFSVQGEMEWTSEQAFRDAWKSSDSDVIREDVASYTNEHPIRLIGTVAGQGRLE